MPEDRTAIADLIHEYAHRLDAGDLEAVAALFGRATYRTAGTPEVLEGAAAVLAAQDRLVRRYDGSPRTHHDLGNLIVEVDPGAGTARARSYFTVLHAPPGSGPQVILAGRYHDAFARDDDGWYFTDRLIHLDLIGDLSTHLHLDRLGDLAGGDSSGGGTAQGSSATPNRSE